MADTLRRGPPARRKRPLAAFLRTDAPGATVVLAYAAPVPLLVGLGVVIAGGVGPVSAVAAAEMAASYTAMMLAFFTGIGCAYAVRSGVWLALLAGALLPLLAWLALFLGPPALAVLAALTAAQGARDVWTADGARLPHWYGQLRVRTTPIVVAALVALFLLQDG
jgi:hypothetical protein